jgi:hypothetical protein
VRKVRVSAVAILIFGFSLSVGAFFLWASNGIPYQDATAEMLKAQEHRAVMLGFSMLLGVAIATAGALLFWRNRCPGEQ